MDNEKNIGNYWDHIKQKGPTHRIYESTLQSLNDILCQDMERIAKKTAAKDKSRLLLGFVKKMELYQLSETCTTESGLGHIGTVSKQKGQLSISIYQHFNQMTFFAETCTIKYFFRNDDMDRIAQITVITEKSRLACSSQEDHLVLYHLISFV